MQCAIGLWGAGCALHDTHNELTWSCAPNIDEAGLKDLHIIFEALQNSFSLLAARLLAFLTTVLDFCPPCETDEAVEDFWSAMGIEPDWLDGFVDVNPRWVDGRLFVKEKHRHDLDIISKVSAMMCHVFKFRQFTDSRWLSIGS